MSDIKSVPIKLPDGNPAPTPTGEPRTPAGRTSGDSGVPGQPAVSARQQLEQLKLANRETTLARVAEVISRQQGAAQSLLLDVKGRSLTVQASVGNTTLEAGDWVKVMRAGNELQLMGKLAPAPEAGIARALAQRLPWQQTLDGGLAKLMGALAIGVRQDTQTIGYTGSERQLPLPPAVRQAIEQLIASLPSSQRFTPGASADAMGNQVRQWIEQSGLFAEARLAKSPSDSLPDLKLALGRVITSLLSQQGAGPEQFNRFTPLASPELVQAPLQFPNSIPPPPPQASGEPASVGQMLRMLAGMLNRITVNQLHSQALTARAGGEAPAPVSTMLLELPWVTPQNEPRVAQLKIEQEERDQPGEQKQKPGATEWRLSLAMNLDEVGPLHFDVALRQHQVSARVWAEKQSTLREVQQGLPALRQSLADLGLEVTDIDCRRGIPQGTTTRLEHRLVDTRA